MPDDSVLIRAAGLTKHYGEHRAVDGVDLSIPSGEVFGLLGPNGAGKTTTILMLLGLTEPTAGTARVCGLDPSRYPLAVKRQVGYLPDSVGFYENLTGRQNLRYTAELNELERGESEEIITGVLEEVGLTEAADRPVGEYSRGMRQRLGVADVLIKDPRVVILDEPTAAIDPEGVTEMLALIDRLAHVDDRAVLLASHLLNQVQQSCDRIAIFSRGKIVAQGTPEELGASLAGDQAVYEIRADVTRQRVVDALIAGLGADTVSVEELSPNRWRVSVPSHSTGRLVPALVEAGIELRELRDLGSDLDVIYLRYFSEEVPA